MTAREKILQELRQLEQDLREVERSQESAARCGGYAGLDSMAGLGTIGAIKRRIDELRKELYQFI